MNSEGNKLQFNNERDPSQSTEVRTNKEALWSSVSKRKHLVKKDGDERQPQGNLRKQKTKGYGRRLNNVLAEDADWKRCKVVVKWKSPLSEFCDQESRFLKTF